jgi:autotransporter-associated beta strand protein
MVDCAIRPAVAGNRVCLVRSHALAVLLATTALGVVSARAADATWVGGNAGDTSEWVENNNWTPAAVPNGTATFTNTGVTTVANDNGIVFIGTLLFTGTPNAQGYTFNIDNPFIVNGSGILNNSTNNQIFNVTSGSSLVFQNGSSASGGTGPVTINNQNGGFFILENSSTAGNATIVNTSILQFNDTSTAATAIITNNQELDFFQSSSAGSAVINNAAAATLTFNNTATAGTATLISNGNLQFNNSSTAGSANISNAAGATLGFFNSSDAGSATIINGGAISFNDTTTAANANINNNGTLNFFNSSNAGSALILNNSILQFSDTSTAASAVILNNGTLGFFNSSAAASATIVNNASLAFNNSSTAGSLSFIVNSSAATIGFNDTSSAGTATIANAGTVSFNTSATAANATIFNNNGSFLNFNNASTAGNATIFNNNGSFLNFNNASTAGNAVIANDAGGTIQFLNSSTAGNATITNAVNGTTQFFATATAGSAAINNNGLTQFNGSSTASTAVITTNSGGGVFFVGTSSGGQASFVTNGGGMFDMSGLTSAGTTAGSIAGAGNYFLGSKTLTVGGNNLSTTVSGVIADGGQSGGVGGALTKVGTGTLTLSGINTYTGATTVNAGTLVVDGSTALSSLTTVNAGGTLAGSGTVGTTAIAGGTLAPGSSGGSVFGPLTVQGSLSFTAASTYMVQVSPANVGRTNVAGVTGTATLGGATVNAVFLPGSYVNRQYTLVNAAGGISGTFNPAVISNMANLQSTLSYDGKNAFLNIALVFVPPSGAFSVNQQNVANTLTSFFNATGSIPAAFAGLKAAGLTIASGELGTGVIQSSIKADDLFLNLLLDPSLAGRAGAFAPSGGPLSFAANDETSAYAAKPRASRSERDAYGMVTKAPPPVAQPLDRWSVWGGAYGGSETIGGNAVVGSQDTRASAYGVVAGADYKLSPDSLLGFALAGGGTSFSLTNGLGSGSSDLFQAGAFGRQNLGPAYVSAALGYGWHDVTTNRTVALAGVDQLLGRFRADSFSGRFEGGYRFATPLIGITPYAAAEVVSFDLPAYAERSLVGGGLFALNYAAQTTTDTRSELGLRTDKWFTLTDSVLTLRGRAAWAHDYDPNRAVSAIFQALPGASFVVNGARPDPDSALVSAGAEMKWLNGFSLSATFEGEFSGNINSYSGKGVARYAW